MAKFNTGTPYIPPVPAVPAKPATVTVDLPLPVAQALSVIYGCAESSGVLSDVGHEIRVAINRSHSHTATLFGERGMTEMERDAARAMQALVNSLS